MSTRNPDSGPDDIFFSALLTPHRSLGPRGFMVLMAVTGFLCFYSGMLFLVAGAWPVMAFLGLDVALVWFAFRMNYRSGRAYEEIGVSPQMVIVRRVSPRGRTEEFRFDPHQVRLRVARLHDEGCVRVALCGHASSDHGGEFDIGGFLNPKDRESFAQAFAEALAAARRGITSVAAPASARA